MAITLELAGTFLLKLSKGFERRHWGASSIACYALCFWMMAPAVEALPVGVAYAIWAGVGIVAATVIGARAFGEKPGAIQCACIALVLVGAVGSRLATKA